jgi:hypothetical protein
MGRIKPHKLVPSLKIGGGSNLHNLDAFLVLLAVATGYVYCGRFSPDHVADQALRKALLGWLILVVAIPVMAVIFQKPTIYRLAPTYPVEQAAFQKILDQAHQQNGKVLFIMQRHMVTFNIVRDVAMQPDYERVFLMEMAMANNQAYLQSFEDNLKAHRYDLVVFEPLAGAKLKSSQYGFAEENNAWFLRVMGRLVKYYRLKASFPALDLDVLEPLPGANFGGN